MFRSLTEPSSLTMTVYVDGVPVQARPNETVAALMYRLDRPVCRTTPKNGKPRAPFCLMGVCFDCLAVVDGVPSTQTCMTPVANGMRIEHQDGKPRVL